MNDNNLEIEGYAEYQEKKNNARKKLCESLGLVEINQQENDKEGLVFSSVKLDEYKKEVHEAKKKFWDNFGLAEILKNGDTKPVFN